MKIASVTVLLLWLVVSTSLAQSPAPASQPPMIVTGGDARIEVDPDEATVRLGIVRQAPNAKTAQEQANGAATQILAAVKNLGIPAARIQTSRLTLTPVYAPRGPNSTEAPRIAAYTASNIVSVDLDNLTLTGPVIDEGLKAGANQIEGVRFRLKNDAAARERALRQAVTEARRKAEVIAETLGVRLAGVQEVSEGGVTIAPREDAAVMMLTREAASTPVSPGQVNIHASVTLRYKIQEK
jgi:uncharacterized protein YggE